MDSIRAKKIRRELSRERAKVRARIRIAASFPHGIGGRAGEAPPEPIVSVEISYDPEDDSLFGTMDRLAEAFTEETEAGLLLRCRVDNYQPIGFELLDVHQHPEARAEVLRSFPEVDSVVRNKKEAELRLPLRQAEERFRQLVPTGWPSLTDGSLARELGA